MLKNIQIPTLNWITLGLIACLTWCCFWAILDESALPPDGSIFSLLIIFIIAYLFGELLSLINFPPLLGMLISGSLIGNIFQLNVDPQHSYILRNGALTIILLRAGLGLNPEILKKLSFVCLRLAFIPCIFEATTIAFVTYFLLSFPLIWGFLMGFVLAAVSSAVVVPRMLLLQEKQLGTNKGIPTLVMASGSVDNVLAITSFGVFLAIAFDTGSSLFWTIFKGPLEAIIGLLIGSLIGIVLWFFPYEQQCNSKIKYQRSVLLILSGIFTIFASSKLNFNGSGPLGCLTLSFVASLRWRSSNSFCSIESMMKMLWLFLEPFLFSLIGIQVKFENLQNGEIGYCLLALFIGLIIRIFISAIVVWGGNLNIKEKLFVGLSWSPKATVQAAIGPVALELVRNNGDEI